MRKLFEVPSNLKIFYSFNEAKDKLHELRYSDNGLKAFGKIYNDELNELYSSNNRVNKAISSHGEENKYIQAFGEETDHFEDTGVHVVIILKCISRKQDGMARAGFIWLRIRTCGGI